MNLYQTFLIKLYVIRFSRTWSLLQAELEVDDSPRLIAFGKAKANNLSTSIYIDRKAWFSDEPLERGKIPP